MVSSFPGQRISHTEWRDVSRSAKSAHVWDFDGSVRPNQLGGATQLYVSSSIRAQRCFLYRVFANGLMAAFRTAYDEALGRWYTDPRSGGEIVGPPGPGLTVAHFRFYLVGSTENPPVTNPPWDAGIAQPGPTDSAVLFQEGAFFPVPRLLIVPPVDISEICVPCGSPAAQSAAAMCGCGTTETCSCKE